MQAKFQFFLTWDGDSNSPLPRANSSCKFFCDPAWTYCCDEQWDPRIKLSNAVSTKLVVSELTFIGPWVQYGEPMCCQHAWSLTVIADFDVNLDFRAFPYDYQHLNVSIYISTYRNTHLVPLPGVLASDGSFVDNPQGAILQLAFRYCTASSKLSSCNAGGAMLFSVSWAGMGPCCSHSGCD